MNSQLYTAAAGLLVEQRRLEVIGNNLANLSTHGYRAQRLFSTIYQRFAAAAPESVRAANASVAVAGAYEVPGGGPPRQTGRALDLALPDGTFLAVSTQAGRRYTRDGSLQVSSRGELVDSAGRQILDRKNRPITGLGVDASIGADGRVTEGGAERARLRLVRDPQRVLRREGDGLLRAADESRLAEEREPALRPGWIEDSATNALDELVRLIEAQRAFESYQKLVSMTMNEVNRRAANDLAG
jgi:flagellar basal body rod protein FlgG